MRMVIERELRANARRIGTYWTRCAAVAFAALALMQNVSRANGGRNLFITGLVLAFIAAILDGIRRGASGISAEKNEGTFGLLTLTPLTGPEILCGKLAAAGLQAFQTGLAVLPVLAASLLLGGVSAGEFLRAAIVLAHTLSIALIVSLSVSCRVNESTRAMLRAGFLLFTGALFFSTCALTDFFFLRAISPMTPIYLVTDSQYAVLRGAFWASILVTQAIAWFSFWKLGRRLIPEWRAEQERETMRSQHPFANLILQEGVTYPLLMEGRAPRWFSMNPFQWLTLRDINMHNKPAINWIVAPAAIFGAISGGAGIFILIVTTLGLIGWLSVAAARPLAKARHSGALELLITTPFNEREMMQGHISALRHVFFWPFIFISGAIIISTIFGEPTFRTWWFIAYLLGGLWMLFAATPYIGTAIAFKTPSPERAVFWTIFFVLILPRIFACIFGDLIYFSLALLAASQLVDTNFRRWTSERFIAAR